MPCDFNGLWQSVQADGTDELLAALGVTDPNIRAAAKKSIEEIKLVDNSMQVAVKADEKVLKETNYFIGQKFEDSDPAGNLWKCVASWKGDVMLVDAKNDEKGWTLTVTREIKNNEMIVVRSLTQDGKTIVSTGRFQKI
ncbi:cellular retinoic acid-binding protein 1-like [Lineus longissimus]|uniref:cellular retinoic acid-binding protein 1-like n=1 Tax=Lineus longissimus TaxID=88925 RepID=UPI002B4E3261